MEIGELDEDSVRLALEIRLAEEKLLWAFSRGMVRGTVHTCIGQEFSGVAFSRILDPNKDWMLSNHRGHGHFLSFNGTTIELFSELLGKKSGPSLGNGGSQHIRKGNFLTNGIQAGFTPIAVGIAEALKQNTPDGVCVVFIGDGTLGEGTLWESLNLAGVYNSPVVFVCETNSIAQSTSVKSVFSGNLKTRIRGFGIEYSRADTNDPLHLFDLAEKVVDKARTQRKPQFIEICTQRLMSHSKGDDTRSRELIEELWSNDWIKNWEKQSPNSSEVIDEILQKIENDFESAFSEETSKETNFIDDVNVEVNDQSFKKNSNYTSQSHPEPLQHRVQLRNSLDRAMELFPNLKIYGEDIEYLPEGAAKSYGGAFKITWDLSSKYPGRVINTPISEAAIVGMGIGRALAGFPTIIEIMFGDFITLALDQIIQQASKIPTMYGTDCSLPIIIRTPMGGGFGYGATHSQSLEKQVFGLPNVNVIATNTLATDQDLYSRIVEQNSPYIVIENKQNYNEKVSQTQDNLKIIKQRETVFPTLEISRKDSSPKLCIVTYGGSLNVSLQLLNELFEKYSIEAEIMLVQQLSPLDLSIDFETKNYSHLLVIEEGIKEFGWGAEVISRIYETSDDKIQTLRFGSRGIIGTSQENETSVLPNIGWLLPEVLKFYIGESNENF